MNYSDLSDFEINKLVAKCEGFNLFKGCVTKSKGESWVRLTPHRNFDPCNNPSDAWPIIKGGRISISPHCVDSNDNWEASLWCSDELGTIDIWHKNPLRAAMIVYLMMKGLV